MTSAPSAFPAIRLCALALLLALPGCKEEAPIDAAAAARGAKTAESCAACHDLFGRENRIGPSLAGVIGREAGTVRGFEYSAGMRQAGFSWDPARIATFVQNPAAMVADTKMAFGEITEAEARDVAEYLRSLRR